MAMCSVIFQSKEINLIFLWKMLTIRLFVKMLMRLVTMIMYILVWGNVVYQIFILVEHRYKIKLPRYFQASFQLIVREISDISSLVFSVYDKCLQQLCFEPLRFRKLAYVLFLYHVMFSTRVIDNSVFVCLRKIFMMEDGHIFTQWKYK